MAAITFPLPLSAFADLLKIKSVTADIQRNDQIDGLENGQILASEIAPPLRKLTVNIAPLSYDEDSEISAIIESMDGSIQPFYMFVPPRLYPQSDPKGSLIAGHVITITNVNSDGKSLTLSGFPVGYKVTRGDFVSFNFGGAANLRALHRAVQTVAADASGNAIIEFRPHIHPGTATGTIVTLVKPALKAIMIPGTYNPGTVESQFVSGKSFQIIERY